LPRHHAPHTSASLLLLVFAGSAPAQERPAESALVTPATPVAEAAQLSPGCPGPAVLVTRDGTRLDTADGFEVDGGRMRYHNAGGTLIAVRLSEIDAGATVAAERRRCGHAASATGETTAAEAAAAGARPPDPVTQVIEAIAELGVDRGRLEALSADPVAFRAAVDAVVEMATELERRTREIERTYRLDTVGGMIAAAPAYRRLPALVRESAAGVTDARIRAVLEDLAVAFDEVARLAAEEPERAIVEFQRQGVDPP
jgi:hypothetical protein